MSKIKAKLNSSFYKKNVMVMKDTHYELAVSEMMTAIQDLKYEPSSCKFSFDYSTGSLCKTTPFILNDCWNKCHLTLSLTSFGQYYQHNVNFTLEFEKKISFDENQNFELIAYFGESTSGYAFLLSKLNDRKFYSQSLCICDQAIFNKSKYSVHIKINFHNNDSDALKQNMNDILLSKTYSDIRLIVDDKVFDVHKIILSSRNKVLAKMIEDMHKKQLDIINLPGWDPTAVEELLKYIYSGECDVKKTPYKLFKLSHFLQINELQKSCMDYLNQVQNI